MTAQDPLLGQWTDVRQVLNTPTSPPDLPAEPHKQPEREQGRRTFADRARTVGHWARDTGLGITGFILVLIVALAGWTASFIGLHDFGMRHMGLDTNEAWLVPVTFDGAAAGLSLVVFRASIHGRGATIWRLLIIVFTALSAWINWVHIADPTGRWIASFMPPAAVVLFEGLMSEARAAAQRRLGCERPRLHPLRWLIDRAGTWAIYRAYVLGIELPEHLRKAPPTTLPEAPQQTAVERPDDTPQSAPDGAPAPAPERPAEAPQDAPESATEPAPKRPAKAPRKAPGKRPKVSKRSAAKSVIRALYDDLGRRPLESEMVSALVKAKAAHTSRQFANTLRREIEKSEPQLAALGTDNVRTLSTGS